MPIFLGIFTILIFSLVAFEAAFHLNLFSGFRQISILMVFFIIWFCRRGGRTVPHSYSFSIMALSALLVAGALISGIPLTNLIIGTFMTIEFGLIFYLASSTRISAQQIFRYSWVFLAFILLNTLSAFIGYIEKFPAPMRQDVGVQGDAGFFASALNIGIILLLGMNLWRKKQAYVYLAALLSLVIFLTVIKKALIINMIIWVLWASLARNKISFKRILLIFIAFGLVGSLALGALLANLEENMSYLNDVGVEEHVRFIMYFASVQIALDHFPFGSGAGSFGSLASISNYFSPLYDLYGASIVPTNSREAVDNGTHTILDTYWPHILAESGFIGAGLLVYLFLIPIRKSIAAFKKFDLPAEIKFCAFVALCIPLSLSLEGFALYTTEAPSFIIFLGGLSGYCFRLTKMATVKIIHDEFNNKT
ncbi:hypothetical protein B9Z51_06640 [Limnohabitans sp. T6-5]|uniref:O-antigen ligase family protein n=1 Tax=Limnohabitans sp. T6-5 TaxID=1100724 RepID=UPI000D3B8D34|nr:hypothetical protein [Limnohabitans sp. T6-5]PUE08623.1 hypothetical protein B9Z51_06640 [Limnohabitans sp. T6-5]